ncbi:unnamed protein product [Miscanthus lutarioriparius]|uniref:Uncharacterized protein n=1 Tax=Miscanthus lutarioriparius TaxID=422564 RepID=A0A811QBK0_9POAL|nr:unnamed protein product [Miscanthus lutarioriparius]
MQANLCKRDGGELRLLDKDGNVLRVFDMEGRALLAPTRLDFIFVDRAQLGAMIIDPVSGRDFRRRHERSPAARLVGQVVVEVDRPE